jgi:hypothetical protein
MGLLKGKKNLHFYLFWIIHLNFDFETLLDNPWYLWLLIGRYKSWSIPMAKIVCGIGSAYNWVTYIVPICPPIPPSSLLGLCFHRVLPLLMHWVFLVLVYFVLVKALVGSKIMIICSNEMGTNQKKDARRHEIA